MNPPLRVGIVGTGMIGRVHLRSARQAGAEVIGIVGSTPSRSREVARDWGVPHGHDSLDALLDSRPDVLHICTPNNLHAPAATAALEAGVHVICEKPLGMTAAEADALATLATASGLVATVPFVYRYHPMVREIRARRERGDFGRNLLIHGSYLQDWMLSPNAASWRVDPTVGGSSRAFADIGSHWVDLVEWVAGEHFTDVLATTTIAHPERPTGSAHAFTTDDTETMAPVTTEDAATVILKARSGVVASAVISQVSAGRKNRLWFELDGTTGSAAFDQENPEHAWLGSPEGSEIIVRDPTHNLPDAARLSIVPAGHPQGYLTCFDAFIADTYTTIRGGTPHGLPTFADGARAAHIIDAVVHSNTTHAWSAV